jgi:small-conductance mechanosensitive channel
MNLFGQLERLLTAQNPGFLRIVITGLVAIVILIGANAILKKRIERLEEMRKKGPVRFLPLLRFIKKIALPLTFLALLYFTLQQIYFSENLHTLTRSIFALVVTIIIVRSIIKAVEISFDRYFEKHENEIEREKSLKPLLSLISFIAWIVGAIFLMANLGFDVSTALAGLGVGGIAVAIAAQGILGDLFSYFVIFFDKPFQIGDFIIFGDKAGVVERIGIKSSHIRILNGEILVVSNSDLTSSRIHNYKKMERRRLVFSVTVPYETDEKKLKLIPQLIKQAIESVKTIEGILFDRSHLQNLGPYAYVFETVYYVPSPNYNVYMDVQQEIYLNIVELFSKNEIKFAYPTQRYYAQNNFKDI